MDPLTALGLATTASQLAQTTMDILRGVCLYISAIKNAPAQAAELRNELAVLNGVLTNLKVTLEHCPEKAPEFDTINISIEGLRDVLTLVGKRVEHKQVTGFTRLKWPFKSDELVACIDKLQRASSALNLALNSQQL